MKENQRKKIKAIFFSCALTIATIKNYNNITAQSNVYENENFILDLSTNQNLTEQECMDKKLSITKLQITLSKKEDLSWIASLKNLETLKLYNYGKNTDLSFLKELSNLKEFTFYEQEFGEKTNFEFLKNCENLERLEIISPKTFDLNIIKNMKNLEELSLLNGNFLNLDVIKECSKLETLKITVEEKTETEKIETLTNLKKLKLYIKNTEHINYQKLTFLEELSFTNSKPYSIVVNFTTKDYEVLKSHGVKITSDNNSIEKVIEINHTLDEIVKQIGRDKETEEEKVNAILKYILKELNYDKTITNLLKQKKDATLEGRKFYEEGLLYGALEKDSAICGNYAALFNALAKRLSLESYYLQNSLHAWNLVKINNKYYYIDATYIDTNYENAELRVGKETLKWSKEEPKEKNDIYHEPNNFPLSRYIK